MKIGFAGAGAVGCHYGSKLQQAGFDLILLARGAHLKALQTMGLQHDSGGKTDNIAIAATDEIKQLKDCGIIIISCKMTDLANMISALQPIVQTNMLLVTLQNGVEAPDLVATAFPGNAIAAGTAFIGAQFTQPGHLVHSAAGSIRMGLWQQGDAEYRLAPLIESFQLASVPAKIETDPTVMLWRKLLWNCGFNAITAITQSYARDIAANKETLHIVQQAMQEAVAIAQKECVNIDQHDIAKHIEITLKMGDLKTSMWQDIESGKQTEVDYMNGYIAKKAERLHIAAPTNRMLTSLIHAME